MMALHRDASTELLRAVRKRAGTGATLIVEDIRSRPWASATFSGARHQLAFRLEGADAEDVADRFVAGIEAAEFPLRGHVMADVAVIARNRLDDDAMRIRIEALTVEDI